MKRQGPITGKQLLTQKHMARQKTKFTPDWTKVKVPKTDKTIYPTGTVRG